MAQMIDEILRDTPENRQALGVKAQEFVMEHKNCEQQVTRMVDFIKQQII